jgi:hypothetical protein
LVEDTLATDCKRLEALGRGALGVAELRRLRNSKVRTSNFEV